MFSNKNIRWLIILVGVIVVPLISAYVWLLGVLQDYEEFEKSLKQATTNKR